MCDNHLTEALLRNHTRVVAGEVNVTAHLDTEVKLVYEAVDQAENVASVTRTVRIVDTLPPQIELNGSALIELQVGGTIIGTGLPFEDGGISYVGMLLHTASCLLLPRVAAKGRYNPTDGPRYRHCRCIS